MLLKFPSDRGWRASRPIRGDSWQGPAGPHNGGMSSGVHALCFGAVHGLTERLSERAGTPPTTRVRGASRGPRPTAYALSNRAGGCMHAKSETCEIPAVLASSAWIISSDSSLLVLIINAGISSSRSKPNSSTASAERRYPSSEQAVENFAQVANRRYAVLRSGPWSQPYHLLPRRTHASSKLHSIHEHPARSHHPCSCAHSST